MSKLLSPRGPRTARPPDESSSWPQASRIADPAGRRQLYSAPGSRPANLAGRAGRDGRFRPIPPATAGRVVRGMPISRKEAAGLCPSRGFGVLLQPRTVMNKLIATCAAAVLLAGAQAARAGECPRFAGCADCRPGYLTRAWCWLTGPSRGCDKPFTLAGLCGGHRFCDWLTYRGSSGCGPCCACTPCCTPPLYTFFLENCRQGGSSGKCVAGCQTTRLAPVPQH
jgi:hypothetical protein